MSALMHIPVINIFTHDSIGLGEDGPTHQAVEQLTSLRIIPGMSVWRPADVTETAISLQSSLEKLNGPSSLVLTRQSLPELTRSTEQIKSIKKGGYIIRDCGNKIDAIIVSSGSEVHLCVEAAEKLGDQVSTGTLFMNRCDYLDPGLSWTGVKETGKGCSLSEIAYEHLTKPKSFHLRKELK